jgi:hypothetical protein
LWPARTIERLTTGDFMQHPPSVVDLRQRTKKWFCTKAVPQKICSVAKITRLAV